MFSLGHVYFSSPELTYTTTGSRQIKDPREPAVKE